MAQLRFLDMLQNYPFWVFDASGFAGNPLFTIFDPVLGFSGCSGIEINVELKEIKAGNFMYKRNAVKAADASPFTLQRGARFYDGDFYVWITNAIRGLQPVRRNLVVVQFLGFRPLQAGLLATTGESVVGAEVALNALGVDRLPARAWFCTGCLPTRYKAASDHDATSGEVSIMELEVKPEKVDELSLATISPATARTFSLALAIAEAAGAPGV